MAKKGGGIPKGRSGGGISKGGGSRPSGGFSRPKSTGGGFAKSGGGFGGLFGGGQRAKIGNIPPPARPMDPGKARAAQARREAQRARQAEWDGQRGAVGLPPIGGIPGYGGAPGLSGYGGQMGEMTWAQQAQMLQQRFNGLQDDIALTSVQEEMGRVEGQLATLSSRLAELRGNGYLFANHLEGQIEALTDQWEALRDQIDDDIEAQSGQLIQQASGVQNGLQLLFNGQTQLLPQLASAVQTLEQQASSARSAMSGRTSGVAQGIREVSAHLDGARLLLDWVAQASFPFLEGEYIVAGTQARMMLEGDESDDGLLLLTDERLLFERREQVAKRKFLFFTLESEPVKELTFATLLGWIEAVEAQDLGGGFLSGGKEMLVLTLSHEAPLSRAEFQILGGTNEAWAQVIQRARTGEIERERVGAAVEAKEAAVSSLAELPTLCPNCGAKLPTTVVRGQRTITCEYCNFEIRVGG